MKRIDDLAQLKRLVMFYYVVELGSFAKAAEKLHMNRSGISEQISMLEQYLNMRLLHRTTRKLALTSDGELILPQAKKVAETLDAIHDSLCEDLLNGRIRITTSSDFAVHWLSKKLKVFQSNYTGIAFDFMISDDMVDLVEQQIDLAFRLDFKSEDSTLVSQPLLRERLQLYASPEFLQSVPKISHVEKLQSVHWVLLKELEQNSRFSIHKHNSDESFELKPSLFHRVNSANVMIEQVKMGLGVGLLPPSMVEKELEQGSLVSILPTWRGKEVIFSILYSSRRQMPKRVRLFLDFLLS